MPSYHRQALSLRNRVRKWKTFLLQQNDFESLNDARFLKYFIALSQLSDYIKICKKFFEVSIQVSRFGWFVCQDGMIHVIQMIEERRLWKCSDIVITEKA